MHYSVLIYVPNVIGYIRLIILITGWFFYDSVYVFLPLYSLSAFLDGKDTYRLRLGSQYCVCSTQTAAHIHSLTQPDLRV
jgi:hypothetical protein